MNIVFDLDGTLIDSAPDIHFVAATILRGLDRDALTLEQTRSFVGEGSGVFVRRMMAARELDPNQENFAQIHAAFLELYEHAVDRAVFYPGARELLTELKSAGHRLGLCTNKPERPARAVLRHMGMDGLFDAVVAGGMLDSRKPEPAMLLRTIEELGGGPTLYVGDSEIDAQTAERARIPFALYEGGYRKAPVSELHHDWVFGHHDALLAIVEQAGARDASRGAFRE